MVKDVPAAPSTGTPAADVAEERLLRNFRGKTVSARRSGGRSTENPI